MSVSQWLKILTESFVKIIPVYLEMFVVLFVRGALPRTRECHNPDIKVYRWSL